MKIFIVFLSKFIYNKVHYFRSFEELCVHNKVKIFDLSFDAEFRRNFYQNCEQVFNDAYLTDHTLVARFEEKFNAWSGTKYNIAVNNGSSALTVALLSLDLHPGDEVMMQTNTFIACWQAALQAGLKPVLLDIDPKFLGPDLEQMRALTGPRTKALVLTHIGGILTPDLPKIKKFCEENGIFLVEDCAHAHGSSYVGIKAGSWGELGCFSFHQTKVMTAGEGGLVSTASAARAEKVSSIKRFGRSLDNPHVFDRMGHNYKMSELTAAFLLTEEMRSSSRISRRQQIAKVYKEALTTSQWQIFWPPESSECSFYKVIARGPLKRAEVAEKLLKKDIQIPNGVYNTPLHRQPVVQSKATFTAADTFCTEHFCLPCYPELTDAQIEHVIKSLKEIAG